MTRYAISFPLLSCLSLLAAYPAASETPPRPTASGDDMQPGEVLAPGQSIQSPNGRYALVYQGDGNLVLTGPAGPLWASNTSGRSVGAAVLETDGRLVVYGSDFVNYWDSAAGDSPGSRLVVQDDGNVVIHRPDGTALWATETTVRTAASGDDIGPGELLPPGQPIRSPNGRYSLVYQGDGNLVLSGPAGPLWGSDTFGRSVGAVVMLDDGNLVIQGSDAAAVWETGTAGNPGSRLVVQDDGNMVIRRPDGAAVWATETTVRPTASGDDIGPGELLPPGHPIRSANGRYSLVYQGDGNLVLSGPAGPLWGSNTFGRSVGAVVMLDDGNLVIQGSDSAAVWETGTAGNPGSRLVVQDDGNVVIHRPDGAAVWATVRPTASGDDIGPGELLPPGQPIRSPNGRYVLVYQGDGNLVLTGPAGPLWASDTFGRSVGAVVMQADGNLVIQGSDSATVWESGTGGNPGSRLVMQDDGNVVIHRPDGAAVWATETTVRPTASGDDIGPGELLPPGQPIRSPNGRYVLVYQGDGNLVLTGPAGPLWASDTFGRSVGAVVMLADGNLVVQGSDSAAVWESGTGGNPGSRLVVRDDGNVVIHRPDGAAVWATETGGRGQAAGGPG